MITVFGEEGVRLRFNQEPLDPSPQDGTAPRTQA
jgi:hypothetical protein